MANGLTSNEQVFAIRFERQPINEQAILDQLADRGSANLEVAVHGFWSTESINIYVKRGYSDAGVWETQVSHSSGGRDKKEVESDTQAERNFAKALCAACDWADIFMADYGAGLELAYQMTREADKAERLALIENDPALTVGEARIMMSRMEHGDVSYRVFNRGADRAFHNGMLVSCRKTRSGAAQFRFAGQVVSRDHLLCRLIEKSNNVVEL